MGFLTVGTLQDGLLNRAELRGWMLPVPTGTVSMHAIQPQFI